MATSLDQALIYFVDLRVQLRGCPQALAIVDRCLSLLTRARTADAETLAHLEDEVESLRRDLLAQYGPKPPLRTH